MDPFYNELWMRDPSNRCVFNILSIFIKYLQFTTQVCGMYTWTHSTCKLCEIIEACYHEVQMSEWIQHYFHSMEATSLLNICTSLHNFQIVGKQKGRPMMEKSCCLILWCKHMIKRVMMNASFCTWFNNSMVIRQFLNSMSVCYVYFSKQETPC